MKAAGCEGYDDGRCRFARDQPSTKQPGDHYMDDNEPDILEETETQIEDNIREPDMYKVLLHNDDYTTMEFVIEVLMAVFFQEISGGHPHHAGCASSGRRRVRCVYL